MEASAWQSESALLGSAQPHAAARPNRSDDALDAHASGLEGRRSLDDLASSTIRPQEPGTGVDLHGSSK